MRTAPDPPLSSSLSDRADQPENDGDNAGLALSSFIYHCPGTGRPPEPVTVTMPSLRHLGPSDESLGDAGCDP
jgi:hypothetical protein